MDFCSLKDYGDDGFGIIIQIAFALNPHDISNYVGSFRFASQISFLPSFSFEKIFFNAEPDSRWQFKAMQLFEWSLAG
jgi:hypothetical protein